MCCCVPYATILEHVRCAAVARDTSQSPAAADCWNRLLNNTCSLKRHASTESKQRLATVASRGCLNCIHLVGPPHKRTDPQSSRQTSPLQQQPPLGSTVKHHAHQHSYPANLPHWPFVTICRVPGTRSLTRQPHLIRLQPPSTSESQVFTCFLQSAAVGAQGLVRGGLAAADSFTLDYGTCCRFTEHATGCIRQHATYNATAGSRHTIVTAKEAVVQQATVNKQQAR